MADVTEDANKTMVIKVDIADKPYRMTIAADEEEIVRRAALRIKTEIAELKRVFATSHIDYLAMAALKISIENEHRGESLKFSTERLQIQEMARQLEEILENE